MDSGEVKILNIDFLNRKRFLDRRKFDLCSRLADSDTSQLSISFANEDDDEPLEQFDTDLPAEHTVRH